MLAALGIVPEDEESPAGDTAKGDSVGLRIRQRYSPLELQNPTFKFIAAGISIVRPLGRGSVVVVVFRGRLYLGQGTQSILTDVCNILVFISVMCTVEVVYVKGGGEKPTHTYSENRFDVAQLSRFAIRLHTAMAEGRPGWLSPVMKLDDGRILESTFLFLRSKHLVVLLDGCITGPGVLKRLIQMRHNQWILEGSPALLRSWHSLQRIHNEIIKVAD